MSDKRTIIKKGKHFTISTGEYSNYQLYSFQMARKDFCIDDVFSEYLSKNPLTEDNPYIDEQHFLTWFFSLNLSIGATLTDINITFCKPYLTIEEI